MAPLSATHSLLRVVGGRGVSTLQGPCRRCPLAVLIVRGTILRGTAVTAGSILIFVITGCTGHSSGTSAPPSLSAPSLSGRALAEQRALDAYRGMWTAYAKAGLTANPDEPDLARYATGDALNTLVKGLTNYRKAGQILKGDVVNSPSAANSAVSVDPSRVDVVDCIDDTRFLVYVAATGALVDDVPGGRRSTTAVVADTGGGTWKVSSFAVKAVGTC